MNRSKLDPNQIMQYEHDDSTHAKKVTVVDADIAMELSADDGDSVQTQGRMFEYTPASEQEIDITACKQIKVYGTGSIITEISPDASGDTWITIDSSTDMSPILDVLARRARVTSSGTIKVLGRG